MTTKTQKTYTRNVLQVPQSNLTVAVLLAVAPTTSANPGFFESLSLSFNRLSPQMKVLVLLLACGAAVKGIEVLILHRRSLYAGYCRADNRLHWMLETAFGLLMMLFNPFKAVTWLAIFLTRNCIGLTPYFAWTFFISLILYIGLGMLVLAKTSEGSWIRPVFYVVGPLWLVIVTLFYDWGYLPAAVLVPAALSSTPTTFRLACLFMLPRPFLPINAGDSDDENPFTKPTGVKPGRPIIRGPLNFMVELGSLGLSWGTAHWALNGFLASDSKPGTFGYVMKNRLKGFSTSYGMKVETYVDDYVAKHGLENDIDGRRRGTAEFFRHNKPTSAQMLQLFKQSGMRAAPFAISGFVAYGVTKAVFAVDKLA